MKGKCQTSLKGRSNLKSWKKSLKTRIDSAYTLWSDEREAVEAFGLPLVAMLTIIRLQVYWSASCQMYWLSVTGTWGPVLNCNWVEKILFIHLSPSESISFNILQNNECSSFLMEILRSYCANSLNLRMSKALQVNVHIYEKSASEELPIIATVIHVLMMIFLCIFKYLISSIRSQIRMVSIGSGLLLI